MTADLISALAIYFGAMAVVGGAAYYLWMWGDK